MDTFPSSYGPLDDILAQHSSTFHVLKCGHTVTSQNLSDCGKNCAFPLPVERKDFSYGCRACISRSDRKLIHAVKVVGGAIFDHDPIQNPNAEGEDDLVSLHDTTLSNIQVRNLNDKLAGRKVFVAYLPPSTDKLQHPKITWAMMLDSSWQRLQAEMRTNFQLFNEPLTMEQAARRLRARVEQVGSSGQTINRPLQATPTTGESSRSRHHRSHSRRDRSTQTEAHRRSHSSKADSGYPSESRNPGHSSHRSHYSTHSHRRHRCHSRSSHDTGAKDEEPHSGSRAARHSRHHGRHSRTESISSHHSQSTIRSDRAQSERGTVTTASLNIAWNDVVRMAEVSRNSVKGLTPPSRY